MDNKPLWTHSGARLRYVRSSGKQNLNWLFLPGGPGLGSESLLPLIDILQVPGTLWCLDLPGDGSNTNNPFSGWQEALVEATSALPNAILVAHSRGGMFSLATPELEKNLLGIVLMATAPDMTWQKDFESKLADFPLPEADKAAEIYTQNPSNSTLRECVLKAAPRMFFTREAFKKAIPFLEILPFNYEAFRWTEENFDPFYKAKWVPNIPTMILSGEKDIAIPIKYFKDRKEYKKSSVLMREIKNAGHFPWIENPPEVINAFNDFFSQFDSLDEEQDGLSTY